MWLLSYLIQQLRRLFNSDHTISPIHIAFCIVDHFEPFWAAADKIKALQRVKTWVTKYPQIAMNHSDSTGKQPRYTFFYPEEEYDYEAVSMLDDVCHTECGEVEIHLHHNDDTSQSLRDKITTFKEILVKEHSLLSTERETGEVKYGFIHGNWALDNSRKDGSLCGVNNELTILKETGCYADFTMPSAPDETQTKKINSIYYATDDPIRPKSHDSGVDVKIGSNNSEDLLIIQGPLGLNWSRRKWGVVPRIENGSVMGNNPINLKRINLWVKHSPRIKGLSNWIFVKIYTHGCQEKNMNYLLENGLERLFNCLETNFNDGQKSVLVYVSARELYNLIKSLEAEADCASDEWRDYRLLKHGVR